LGLGIVVVWNFGESGSWYWNLEFWEELPWDLRFGDMVRKAAKKIAIYSNGIQIQGLNSAEYLRYYFES